MEKDAVCPLLKDPLMYLPDSLDLLIDEEARIYWLKCLEGLGQRFVDKVCYLHPKDDTALERAEKCKEKFSNVLQSLQENPSIYGNLSVRSLLDLNEQIFRDNGFEDAWLYQKHLETKLALQSMPVRLAYIDSIVDEDKKWEELCKGVIAGNMFDWGAKAVSDIFENSVNFGLNEALSKIEARPWLIDDLDEWIQRIKASSYKSIVIFVDNAGIDLFLGILPLAREFLKCGSTVILSANSKPALNDVTHKECEYIFNRTDRFCSVINEAITNQKLLFYESGSCGPCLDLRHLHPDLCKAIINADLLILEGMGRAVHTNLYARFNIDCLKVAVIKNDWWAKRLGGKKFSVVFQYEPVL